jgi:thiamine pyrophosphokinase
VRAIVLADGDVAPRPELDAAWPGWADDVALVVAADGGARHAEPLGLAIDRWVGDGDSLGAAGVERLRASGIPMRLVAADKDESDTELAVLAAVEAGADDLVVLGAFGGERLDHELANVGLLAHDALAGSSAVLLDATARVRLVRAPDPAGGEVRVDLGGRPGDLVSLLPFGGAVEGITTRGLRYPLRDEPLAVGPARGLSNVRLTADAWINVRAGSLLVVETPVPDGPATLSP